MRTYLFLIFLASAASLFSAQSIDQQKEVRVVTRASPKLQPRRLVLFEGSLAPRQRRVSSWSALGFTKGGACTEEVLRAYSSMPTSTLREWWRVCPTNPAVLDAKSIEQLSASGKLSCECAETYLSALRSLEKSGVGQAAVAGADGSKIVLSPVSYLNPSPR